MARVKADLINLLPDYMSILIGVNDVWHEISKGNGIDAEKYEIYYNMLIEPFVLRGTATDTYWDEFYGEVKKRAEASKRVAEKNNLIFVPLMDKFMEAKKLAPAEYWLFDGVHPTAMGHEIKRVCFGKLFCCYWRKYIL